MSHQELSNLIYETMPRQKQQTTERFLELHPMEWVKKRGLEVFMIGIALGYAGHALYDTYISPEQKDQPTLYQDKD